MNLNHQGQVGHPCRALVIKFVVLTARVFLAASCCELMRRFTHDLPTEHMTSDTVMTGRIVCWCMHTPAEAWALQQNSDPRPPDRARSGLTADRRLQLDNQLPQVFSPLELVVSVIQI